MKTTSLKSFIGTGLAAALALAVWFPTPAPAQIKGAQQLTTPTATAPVTATAAPAMSCPKCKSEFTTRVDTSVRGVNKPVVTIERHLCGGCETSQVQTGTGKNAKNVTVHSCNTCGSGAPSSCCDKSGAGM